MHHAFSYEFDGYNLSGLAEIEPAEPATDVDPPFPAIVTVVELFINHSTHSAIDIIGPDIVAIIEERILKEIV